MPARGDEACRWRVDGMVLLWGGSEEDCPASSGGGRWIRLFFEGAPRRDCPAPCGDAALSIEAALQVCRRALRLQRHRVCKHACAFRELALTLTLTLTTNPNQRRRAGPDGAQPSSRGEVRATF